MFVQAPVFVYGSMCVIFWNISRCLAPFRFLMQLSLVVNKGNYCSSDVFRMLARGQRLSAEGGEWVRPSL